MNIQHKVHLWIHNDKVIKIPVVMTTQKSMNGPLATYLGITSCWIYYTFNCFDYFTALKVTVKEKKHFGPKPNGEVRYEIDTEEVYKVSSPCE